MNLGWKMVFVIVWFVVPLLSAMKSLFVHVNCPLKFLLQGICVKTLCQCFCWIICLVLTIWLCHTWYKYFSNPIISKKIFSHWKNYVTLSMNGDGLLLLLKKTSLPLWDYFPKFSSDFLIYLYFYLYYPTHPVNYLLTTYHMLGPLQILVGMFS